MPLSALLHARRVDLIDQRDDRLWRRLRARGVSLSCVDCGRPMHTRVSPLGLRFFAHNPSGSAPQLECAIAGESPEHLRLKLALAAAAREAGWHTEVEAARSNWRADILAQRGNRLVALEAQLAGQSSRDAAMRTHRYKADRVDTFWFTTATRPGWGRETGWITVDLDDLNCSGPWLNYDPHPSRVPVALRATGQRSLTRVVEVLLDGHLIWHPAARRAHEGWVTTTACEQLRRDLWHRLAGMLASHRNLREQRHAARRRLEETRERRRQERESAPGAKPLRSRSEAWQHGHTGPSPTVDPAELAVLQQTSRTHVLNHVAASGNRIGTAPIVDLFEGGWEFAHGTVAITASQAVVVIVPYTLPELLTEHVRQLLRAADLVVADTRATADQLVADGIPAGTLSSINGKQATLW